MKAKYDVSKFKPGIMGPKGKVLRPRDIESADTSKTRITIRIDTDLLEWFKAAVDQTGGGSYQAMMNRALRQFVEGAGIEARIGKIIRKEFRRAEKKTKVG